MIRIIRPPSAWCGDLILEERPRPLSSREINLLPFAERLNLVQTARGRTKYNLILDAPDPEALVTRLPVQDFYLLVRELGTEDAGELLAMASTRQLTALIDFDGWPTDQLDPEAALRWLALLLETGEEQVLRTMKELDFGLLVLLIGKQITVLRAPGDLTDDDVRVEATRREGGYELAYRDPEHAKEVAALLDILYRLDSDYFSTTLEAIRWEMGAELEEDVYQQRCGRLLDLGLVDPHDALGVYARIDPARFAAATMHRRPAPAYGDEASSALILLESARPGGLLGAVMREGIAEAVANDLVFLINKVLSADRVDIGEEREVRAATERVYALLNLALEHLCGHDVQAAAQLLAERYPEDLFRYGFSLTLELRQRARELSATPIAPFLDGPFRAGIASLRRDRPLFYEGITGTDRTTERLFASIADLAAAQLWLDGIEAQRRFFVELAPFPLPTEQTFPLDGCEPAVLTDLTLSELFLTALANRISGRPFTPEPIPAAELADLQRRIVRDGRLDATLRAETAGRFEAEVAGLGRFVDWALDLWQEGFCAVPPEDLDPRYVDGLIVRR